MYKINKCFIVTLALFLFSSINSHIFASGAFQVPPGVIDYYKSKQRQERYLQEFIKQAEKEYISIIKELGNDKDEVYKYLRDKHFEYERYKTFIENNKLKPFEGFGEYRSLYNYSILELYLLNNDNIKVFFQENEIKLKKEKEKSKNVLIAIIFFSCLIVFIIIINIITKGKLKNGLMYSIFGLALLIDIILISENIKSFLFVYKMTPIIQLYNNVWRSLL
jgi:hypothetical protein